MNRILLILILLLVAVSGYAQKDSVLNLPTRHGKLEYSDTITVNKKSRVKLDSISKNWFNSYFKYKQLNKLQKETNNDTSLVGKGLLEFRISPSTANIVKYDFFINVDVSIICHENSYSYDISNIYFFPQNEIVRKLSLIKVIPHTFSNCIIKHTWDLVHQ